MALQIIENDGVTIIRQSGIFGTYTDVLKIDTANISFLYKPKNIAIAKSKIQNVIIRSAPVTAGISYPLNYFTVAVVLEDAEYTVEYYSQDHDEIERLQTFIRKQIHTI